MSGAAFAFGFQAVSDLESYLKTMALRGNRSPDSLASGHIASTGTVMVAVLPIILGFQLLLNFLAFDMANEPKHPLQPAPSLTELLSGTRRREATNVA